MLSIKRALKSAFLNTGRQKFISTATILTLVVFFCITNFLAFSYYAVYRIANYLETRPNITVWFQIGTSEDQILSFKKKVEDTNKTSEVKYFSEADSANDFLELFKGQPIYTSSVTPDLAGQINARINIKPQKIEFLRDLTQQIETEKLNNSIIEDISSEFTIANRLNDLLTIIRILVIAFVIIFFVVLVLLNFISVQLSIQTRKEEIKVMELVGADKGNIRLPFVFEGALLGIFSGLLSAILTIIIVAILVSAYNYSPTIKSFVALFAEVQWPTLSLKYIAAFVVGELGLGALIGSIANFIAVRKYIR